MSLSDDQLEARLRQYRPASAPPSLRSRVVASVPIAPGRGRMREWMPAAAVALMAMLFYWMAAVDRRELRAQFPPVEDSDVEVGGVWR
jgi:hypothetical protein